MNAASVQNHPSADELRRFASGLANLDEIAAIEKHLGGCNECCTTLKGIASDTLVGLLRKPKENDPPQTGMTTPFLTSAERSDTGEATVHANVSAADGPPAVLSDIPLELRGHTRYRVLGLLGKGGMGSVFRAEHQLMERAVALKVIGHNLTAKPEMVERFRREVKAAAKLSHANIVQAFDAEQAGQTHFLVMEFVSGTDLAHLVRERGPLPFLEACGYVRQAALGLQHAHERGMTHRDIKPHNLMRTEDGTVKILDFGLARFASEAGGATASGTSEGVILGTVDYMAPEQADNAHAADIRSDIYALGCSLYHLLTGRVPFPGGTLLQKIRSHADKEPTPIRQLRPEVPEALVAVIARMMAKDPARRYQTPSQVAHALLPFAGSAKPIPVVKPVVRRPQVMAPTEVLHEAPPRTVRPRRRARPRRRWRLAVALLAVLVGVVFAAGVVFRLTTDRGEITIETNDSDIEIVARKNGEIVRIRDTKTGQVWELDTKKMTLGQADSEDGLRIELDGKEPFILKRRDGRVTIKVPPKKDLETSEANRITEERRFDRIEDVGWDVSISPDGRFGLSNGANLIWELTNGQEIRRLGSGGWIALFSPDRKHALTSDARVKEAILWDVATGKEVRRFTPEAGRIRNAVFSFDGRWAAINHASTVRVWEVATGNQLKVVPAYPDANHSAAFSRDGRRLLVIQPNNTLAMYDTADWKEIRRFKPGAEKLLDLTFSADGRRFLYCAWESADVFVHDVDTGAVVQQLHGPDVGIHTLTLSPDGRFLLTGTLQKTVLLWDLSSGREVARYNGGVTPVSIAYAPDGRHALIGTEEKKLVYLRLPDPPPEGFTEIRRFEGHANHVRAVAWSADGKFVLSGRAGEGIDAALRLWDPLTGKDQKKFEGYTVGIAAVALSPDGNWAAFNTFDKSVWIWDVQAGKKVRQLEGDLSWVVALAFSPDGKQILTGSHDKTMRLWDATTGKELRRFLGHTQPVQGVAFSPDGKTVASASWDKTVRLWNAATGKEVRQFLGHTDVVHAVAFSPDGTRLLSGGLDKTLRLWNTATGREVRQFLGHTDRINTVAYSPDGLRALSASNDGTMRLWDVETGREVCPFAQHPQAVWSVAFSPDGRYAISGSQDSTARVWQLPALPPGMVRRTTFWDAPPNREANIFATTFSPDGRYYLASGDTGATGGVRVWDVQCGRLVTEFFTGKDVWYCQNAVFLPDSRHVLSSYSQDSHLYLWEAATGKLVRTFDGHERNTVWLGGVTPDGQRAVSWGADRTIRVWDVVTGKQVQQFDGTGVEGHPASLSSDGRRLLSSDNGNVLRVWDVETGEELARLKGHIGVCHGCFSPDGQRVLSWGNDGKVRLWDVATGTAGLWWALQVGGVATARFTPDGLQVMAAGNADRTVTFWDLETGKRVRQMLFEGNTVAFDPNGRRLLSSQQEVSPIYVYDLATGKELYRDFNNLAPCAFSFSPDGRFAATGSFRRGVYLYRLPERP